MRGHFDDRGMDIYRVAEMNPQIGGEICFGNCMDVQRNLLRYIEGINVHSGGVVVDHEGIEKIDSSWTASLVRASSLAERMDLPFVLENVSQQPRDLLNTQKLSFLLEGSY